MTHASNSHNHGQRQKNFVAKPNVQTYNLVMDAHIELCDASRAQDMLLEMDATNGVIPPNSESFSKVIRAWLMDELNHNHYGLPGSSLEKAWKWFDELLKRERGERGLGPAPDLFSSILKTAARTSACGENVLTIGQSTFWSMKESRFPPDSDLAYIWLLETTMKVLSSANQDTRREEFITDLCKQICQDGFLSSKFVRTLSPFSNASMCGEGWTAKKSEGLCKELFGDPPCFPSAWSRNVKQEQQPKPSDLVPKGKARVDFKKKKSHQNSFVNQNLG